MTLRSVVLALILVGFSFPAGSRAAEPATAGCAPAVIDGLQLVLPSGEDGQALGEQSDSRSFGYTAAENSTEISVSIYGQGSHKSLRDEFIESGAAVIAAHAQARMPAGGPSKADLAGKSVVGQFGFFIWTVGETDFGSILWIGELSGRFVKIQTTYVRPERDEDTGIALEHAISAFRSVADKICEPSP